MKTATLLFAFLLVPTLTAHADEDHGHHDRGRFLKVGDAAPPFGPLAVLNPGEAKTKSVTFSGKPDGKEHVWIVSTFASWCPGCVTEMPLLRKLDDKFRARGLRIVSVAVDHERDNPGRIAKLLTSAHIRHAVADDKDQEVLKKYEGGNLSLPYMFVIGPDGVIAETHEGFDKSMESSLNATIERLLTGE